MKCFSFWEIREGGDCGVKINQSIGSTSGCIAVHGLIAAFSLSLLLGGCKTPAIVRLTATSQNETMLRAGNTVNFAADVRLNGSVLQTSNLTLQRTRPAGPEITRPLTQASVTGETTRYTAALLPSDTAIAFQQGDRWKATVTVGYPYVDSTAYKSLTQEIEILEPVNNFSFVGLNPLEGWSVLKYHKFTPPYGQETAFTSQPVLQAYPAENFPQPREGDNAIGFAVTLSPNSHWSTAMDNWSAIFVSSRVNGWSSFRVSLKTAVTGLSLLSYVDVVTDPSTGDFRSVPLIVGTDGVHWYGRMSTELIPATAAEGWHTYYFTSAGTELTPGSIHTIHLEVFGAKDGLSAAQGKVVLLDQVIGQ